MHGWPGNMPTGHMPPSIGAREHTGDTETKDTTAEQGVFSKLHLHFLFGLYACHSFAWSVSSVDERLTRKRVVLCKAIICNRSGLCALQLLSRVLKFSITYFGACWLYAVRVTPSNQRVVVASQFVVLIHTVVFTCTASKKMSAIAMCVAALSLSVLQV